MPTGKQRLRMAGYPGGEDFLLARRAEQCIWVEVPKNLRGKRVVLFAIKSKKRGAEGWKMSLTR